MATLKRADFLRRLVDAAHKITDRSVEGRLLALALELVQPLSGGRLLDLQPIPDGHVLQPGFRARGLFGKRRRASRRWGLLHGFGSLLSS